jgi:hypothetical protein
MGITVMVVMGLLSVVALSSIDFGDLEEIRDLLGDVRQDGEDDDFQDTSDLGWLDVDDDIGDLTGIGDLLNFANGEEATSGNSQQEVQSEEEVDPFDSFNTAAKDSAPSFTSDTATDLWPLDEQYQPDPLLEEETIETPEMIELAFFNAEEDALELPFSPKQDDDGNDLPPDVLVAHHEGWTEVAVGDEAYVFAHSANNDFKGLVPEDIALRMV